MKNIYQKMYHSHHRLDLKNNPRIKIMAAIINGLCLRGANILDIGCYDGTFLSMVKNKNSLYGLDASDYAIQKSREKGIRAKQFFLDGKRKIPFKDHFFDLIVAGEIIEHLYDTDFFLEEIRRLLKKGGLLLISTPNLASLGRRLMLFLGMNPLIELSPHEKGSSGHIRYFTFATLKKLLEKHHFKVLISRSDVVNFNNRGTASFSFLAHIFPSLGQSVIFLARRMP